MFVRSFTSSSVLQPYNVCLHPAAGRTADTSPCSWSYSCHLTLQLTLQLSPHPAADLTTVTCTL